MKDFERDAYVFELPKEFGPEYTHAVSVDIREDGEVRHQIVSMSFGEHAAKMTAADLNRWRDQS